MNILRIKQSLNGFVKNPIKILNLFNFKKLYKFIKNIIFNVDVDFVNLTKKKQIKILLESLSKIKNINKNILEEKKLFPESSLDEFEKKYLNNLECNKFSQLFEKYGSDKTKSRYNYFYYEIISQNKINYITEIGMGTNNIKIPSNMGAGGKPGASLRAFSEYMPNCKIYGADIDKKILFQDKNITTFFINQLDIESILKFKSEIPKMDLIIDDGLHLPDANLNIIHNLIDHLNKDGFLIVEDIENIFLDIFLIVKDSINAKKNFRSQLIQDNNNKGLLIIKRIQ